MTVNESIIAALAPLGSPVVPDIYTEKEATYYTFNYDLVPIQFADDSPTFWRALVQVHFFCPLPHNSIQQRMKTVEALVRAGFTFPEIINASTGERTGSSGKDVQHYVFECERIELVSEVIRDG